MKKALIIVNPDQLNLNKKDWQDWAIYIIKTNAFGFIVAITEYYQGEVYPITAGDSYYGPDENGRGFESWLIEALKEKAFDNILIWETGTAIKKLLLDNSLPVQE